jgi:CrcB protein
VRCSRWRSNARSSSARATRRATRLERALVSPALRLLLVTGVLGGFTTFSAFSWESLALLRDAQWPAAFGYVAGSVVAGLLAAFAGATLAAR